MSVPLETPPALITFDFTGTLFEPRSSVGVLYRQVICAEAARESAACGEAADSLSVAALDAAFRSAYAAAAEARVGFGRSGVCAPECRVQRRHRERVGGLATSHRLSHRLGAQNLPVEHAHTATRLEECSREVKGD